MSFFKVNYQPNVELVGANNDKLEIIGQTASTQVQINNPILRKVKRSFAAFEASESSAQEPDRIFLNLENIRAAHDVIILNVYINLPDGANPDDYPELYAGSVSFFGVTNALRSKEPNSGKGLTKVLEITNIIDSLYLSQGLDVSDLNIEFFLRNTLTPEDNVTLERVSIYRQGL